VIVELKEPRALLSSVVAQHVAKGLAAVEGAGYGDAIGLLRDLAEDVFKGARAVLFDVEGTALRGFTILDGYTGPWRTYGWVMHFYAEGRAPRRRLVEGAVRWFYARGVYRVRAINRSGGSDAAFIRAFAGAAGLEGRVVGSVIEIGGGDGERR
jgi:hypothetical protein